MKTTPSFLAVSAIVALAALMTPAKALTNVGLAPNGTPTMGYNPTQNSTIGGMQDFGTFYAGGEGVGNVNDGNLGSYVDDFGSQASFSFVGVTFSSPLATVDVSSLNLYMYTFGDGGWFGQNNVGYHNGVLDSTNLVAPIVQVTYNGTDWTTVASSNTYVTDLTGQTGNSFAPETNFNLTTPVIGIEGIRLLGPNGGTATNSTHPGFIGVAELQVEGDAVPEPSTYAMLFVGIGALLLAARRQLA